MVSIHGPLGYEPNTLTTAPLRCCFVWGKRNNVYKGLKPMPGYSKAVRGARSVDKPTRKGIARGAQVAHWPAIHVMATRQWLGQAGHLATVANKRPTAPLRRLRCSGVGRAVLHTEARTQCLANANLGDMIGQCTTPSAKAAQEAPTLNIDAS